MRKSVAFARAGAVVLVSLAAVGCSKHDARPVGEGGAAEVSASRAESSPPFRDLPQIEILEELHVVTFNDTYWTGWPTAEDPYVAPYTPWEAFNLVSHHLKPAQ